MKTLQRLSCRCMHADGHGKANKRTFASFFPNVLKTFDHWELESEITNTEGVIISQTMLVC
jgi:hypothetical protein